MQNIVNNVQKMLSIFVNYVNLISLDHGVIIALIIIKILVWIVYNVKYAM